MAKTRDNLLTTKKGQVVGKQQIYALLVDETGEAILDDKGNEQLIEIHANTDGSLKMAGKVGLQVGGSELSVANPVPVSIIGSLANIKSAPVTGIKTVTATAAEIFAGASAKSGRTLMLIKSEEPVLRFRIGSNSVNQQSGLPIEPGASVLIEFDPSTTVPIYAISEGASLQVSVWEV